MKLLLLALLLLAGLGTLPEAQAQGKFMTKVGQISFFSATPIADIEARNQQVAAVLDFGSGQLAFTLPIKGFVFKRTLMQEHFNENYMESDKFPKATFRGRFVGFDAAALATAGSHPAQIEGDLTLHGVTHHIQVPATLEMKDNRLLAFAAFAVATADYNIDIPLLVRDNIAKTVSVRVSLNLEAIPGTVGATRATN